MFRLRFGDLSMKDKAGGRAESDKNIPPRLAPTGSSAAGRRRTVSFSLQATNWYSIGCAALCGASLLACSSAKDAGSTTGSGAGNGSATGGTGAGGWGSSGSGGVAPVSEPGKPCRAAVKVGQFTVEKNQYGTYPSGHVQDGVTPTAVWTERQREGDCAVLEKPNPFCDPECLPPQICGLAGSCIAAPTNRSVGTVTITGLSSSVSMNPDTTTNEYNTTQTISAPGFTEGAPIALHASGAVYGPFDLSAQGVAPLTLTNGAVTVRADTPITLTWTPPAQANGRIHITLNLSAHGNDTAALECDVADTGSYQIPGTLVTRLLSLEVAGYPALTVSRRTADSISIAPGCVDLLVQAVVLSYDVSIYGMTYCANPGETTDCPTGQTCQKNQICG